MQSMQTATQWAVMTYGSVMLASDPMGSLPAQLGSQAAYRLLESPQVSYERLMRPHLLQTQTLMQQQRRVLLIEDTTEVDYQQHPKTTGLGPVGQGTHHGY